MDGREDISKLVQLKCVMVQDSAPRVRPYNSVLVMFYGNPLTTMTTLAKAPILIAQAITLTPTGILTIALTNIAILHPITTAATPMIATTPIAQAITLIATITAQAITATTATTATTTIATAHLLTATTTLMLWRLQVFQREP